MFVISVSVDIAGVSQARDVDDDVHSLTEEGAHETLGAAALANSFEGKC